MKQTSTLTESRNSDAVAYSNMLNAIFNILLNTIDNCNNFCGFLLNATDDILLFATVQIILNLEQAYDSV